MKDLKPDSRAWPGGKRAAVSLTYDDGLACHLECVGPDIEALGLRGTFYLPVGRNGVQQRKADWRQMHERGHEIGSHTWHHPCRRQTYQKGLPAWLTHCLEDYSPMAIEDEISRTQQWLQEHVGADPGRTFAYPCHDCGIGQDNNESPYLEAVRKFHPAARVGGGLAVNVPSRMDRFRIHAFDVSATPPQGWIACCQRALACGGWAVLAFHGIGGAEDRVTALMHQAFLQQLQAADYWVAPVREVVAFLYPPYAFNDGRRGSVVTD